MDENKAEASENTEIKKKRFHEHVLGLHLYAFGILRRMYDWVLSWAHTKYGWVALFILAFAEASFFPIPPDVLLIALCVSLPSSSFRFATLSTIGSVLGGILGYYIGYGLYESVGIKIIEAFHYQEAFDTVGSLYLDNAFWSITAAGFTPLPYKVFTIAAGVWKVPLLTVVLASLLSRASRFFLVAGLLYFFGPRMKEFIDKYFNWLTVAFFVLLIGGFVVIKLVL
ncbi:cytochrome B [Candidatus Woesearchaeota archaeon CG10_big_fil_rev_8_21_14_0_10_34_8]|nr:MAG: cytochrome B [Candidatus Woesearchaeota archaeon CG10_big_fil_rev_8_21_14_0_10_34_8]